MLDNNLSLCSACKIEDYIISEDQNVIWDNKINVQKLAKQKKQEDLKIKKIDLFKQYMLDMFIQLFIQPFYKVNKLLKFKSLDQKTTETISIFVEIIKQKHRFPKFRQQLIFILELKYQGILHSIQKFLSNFSTFKQSGIFQYAKYLYQLSHPSVNKHQQYLKQEKKNREIQQQHKHRDNLVHRDPREHLHHKEYKHQQNKRNDQSKKNKGDESHDNSQNVEVEQQKNEMDARRNPNSAFPPKQKSPGRKINQLCISSPYHPMIQKQLQVKHSFSEQSFNTHPRRYSDGGAPPLPEEPQEPKIDPENIIETQQPEDKQLVEKRSDNFNTQKHPYNKNQFFIGKRNEKYQSREGLGLWKSKSSQTNSKFILGQWKNDEVHGLGYTQFKTGKIQFFMGEYKDSLPSQGYMRDQNGAQYFGSFYNGQPHGRGMFIFPNKNYTYKGAFRDGKFHGRGELLDMVTQRTIVGEWKQGMIQMILDSKFFLGFETGKSEFQMKKQEEEKEEEEKKAKAQAQLKQKERIEKMKKQPLDKPIFHQDLKQYEILKKQNPKMYAQILKDRNIDPELANQDMMKSWAPPSATKKQQPPKERKMKMINGKLRFID